MIWDFLVDTFGEEAADWIAKAAVVAGVLLVTWLVRLTLKLILPRLVRRLDRRDESTLDNRLVEALLPPLRFLVGVVGLWVALLTLELSDKATTMIEHVLSSLALIGIFWAAHRSVDVLVDIVLRMGQRTVNNSRRALLDEQLAMAVKQIVRAVVMILAFTTLMEEWGYNIGGLVAGLGIGGLAVALAAQDALANLFGYFIVLADEPFQIGEYIVLGDVAGTVEALGFRSTRIRGPDQSLITIPNKTVANATITNWSRLTKRRLNMKVGIECGSSPERVLSVVQAIREMLQDHDLVQSDSVVVQFVEFSDSSLDIMIICFMKTPDWGDFQAARQDINLRILNILSERGVELAFPSQTVYVQSVEPAASAALEAVHVPVAPEPTASTAIDSPVPSDAAN